MRISIEKYLVFMTFCYVRSEIIITDVMTSGQYIDVFWNNTDPKIKIFDAMVTDLKNDWSRTTVTSISWASFEVEYGRTYKVCVSGRIISSEDNLVDGGEDHSKQLHHGRRVKSLTKSVLENTNYFSRISRSEKSDRLSDDSISRYRRTGLNDVCEIVCSALPLLQLKHFGDETLFDEPTFLYDKKSLILWNLDYYDEDSAPVRYFVNIDLEEKDRETTKNYFFTENHDSFILQVTAKVFHPSTNCTSTSPLLDTLITFTTLPLDGWKTAAISLSSALTVLILSGIALIIFKSQTKKFIAK